MKNRRKMKSILCLMLAAVFVFSCLSVSTSAYTTTTTGEYDISPSKSQFQAAKNPKYSDNSVTIADSISQSYEMDIYHFEAQCDGYYAIYTTGSLDTIGAVYEENGALFWTHYDQVAYSDDTNYSPYYRNCLMVVNMEQYEDYYICVRAYASKTGNYTLIIEPNEDKKTSYQGGVWTAQYPGGPGGAITNDKQYLTKGQALLNYLWLDGVQCIDETTGTVIDFELIRNTYNSDHAAAISLVNTFMSLISCAVPAPLSVSMTLLGIFIQNVYDTTTETLDEVKHEFEEKCNITKTLQTINGNTAVVEYTIQNGLMKKDWFSIFEYTTYYTWNDPLLRGVPYYYGTWQN